MPPYTPRGGESPYAAEANRTRAARRRLVGRVLAGVLILLGAASAPARAQTFQFAEPGSTPGWVFTPTFVFSSAYDDNVTLAGHRAPTESDMLTVVSPSGDLQYRGRHNWLGFGYDGSWSLYRQLNGLNAFDQSLRGDSRHQVTRRVTLLLHENYSIHPSTDVVDLLGVPFLRIGSRMNDARAETRIAAGPHTTVNASYGLEFVSFDTNTQYARFLHGGTAHAFAGGISQQVAAHLSVGADYNFRRAIISANAGQFDIQDASGNVSYQPTPTLTLSGSLGFARLTDVTNQTSQTGPSWRASLVQRFERATLSASYLRSYVPSFGLGGTLQNEEFDANLHMPLARNRVYWEGGVSWRRNQPLNSSEQRLKSLWVQNWVGYALQRWLRIEGYYWRSQQDSQFAGGRVDRNRFGIQLVTSMPMRIH